FWTGGLVRAGDHETGAAVATAAVRVNAFYGVTGALFQTMQVSWNEMGVMYAHGQLQSYNPPPARWYDPAGVHVLLAGMCAGVALLRRRT
ncbi:MAG: hypothetical protein ACOC8F_00730, partial [Planctomycetota bacterium]